MLYFNNEDTFIELTYDQAEAISDFLDSFRLYEARRLLFNAQQLIQPVQAEFKRPYTPSQGESLPKTQGLKPTKKRLNSNDFDI